MGGKDSLKELRIGIGDIVFSTISNEPELRLEVEAHYKQFITNSKPDISLYTHYGYIPESKLGENVFDTGTTWSLYQDNRKYILKSSSKVVILESDFESGDIYIGSRRTRHLDYPLNYPLGEVLMINLLARERGVMVHSCGVNSKGQGLLFVGTSQMGKSTLANLWKSRVKSAGNSRQSAVIDTVILSDDRVIIRKMDERFWLYGTPWHGDAKVSSPEKAPLEKIFFLKHAKKNSIKKIASLESAPRLIVCSFPTFWDKKGMEFTLGFIDELTREVPCYELEFVPDKTVVDFVKDI